MRITAPLIGIHLVCTLCSLPTNRPKTVQIGSHTFSTLMLRLGGTVVHPGLHTHTSRQFYCVLHRRHHPHKQWWEFIWGGGGVLQGHRERATDQRQQNHELIVDFIKKGGEDTRPCLLPGNQHHREPIFLFKHRHPGKKKKENKRLYFLVLQFCAMSQILQRNDGKHPDCRHRL